MYKTKKTYLAIIFLLCLFFLGFNHVDAATLKINSSASNVSVGDSVTFYVVLNSEGVAINNAESAIDFPSDLFDVVSVSKTGSIFSLWVEEPYFSNSSGVVTYNGGLPTPGFNGSQGPVISITAKAKKSGQGEFSFKSAAVRANDGLGTDVLNSKQGKTIVVVDKVTSPVVPVTPVQESLQNFSVEIQSSTHPDQEKWYADGDPFLKWALPSGADSVQTSFDNNKSAIPRIKYAPAIKEKLVKDLDDGIWYFKVRAGKDGKWGPVSTYIVRVDKTAPIKKEVVISYENESRLLNIYADVVDVTSGVDHYEIYSNGSLVKKIQSGEFVNKQYGFEFNKAGDNTVKVLAFDRAGNSVESTGVVAVSPKVLSPQELVPASNQDTYSQNILVGGVSIPIVYVFSLIAFITIILMMGSFHFGRYYGKFYKKFRLHNAMAKGDNLKILLSLKKRLEKHLEILQNTRHNRILSKEEKEIKEAIEGDLDEVDQAIAEHRKEK